MAIDKEYTEIARNVDILSVLRFIEQDLGVDFSIQEASTVNLKCIDKELNPETSVHDTDSTSKTTVSLEKNILKCWNPSCPLGTRNPIGLIQFVYGVSFPEAVKKVLDIGGVEYNEETKELSDADRASILKTNYVIEKSENLMIGFELLEENKTPKNRDQNLYVDAAKYLISRGITKEVAKKLKFGVGGGYSKILHDSDKNLLQDAKIIKLYGTKVYEIMNKRIIIPNIAKGYVVGTTGRAIYDDESKRYLNVGIVNNLINIDNASKYDRIFMFEGGLNAASYIVVNGKDNSMSLQGASTFKKNLLSDLIVEKTKFKQNTEFIYVADCDDAGLIAAQNLGLEILNLGFSLNILITPQDKDGKKIDLNDMLKKYGPKKSKEIWDEYVKTAEPYIVFAIKQEIKKLQGLNPITLELKKCKIMQKYLKLDIIDPNEKWVLEQYFLKHGYPTTKEFFEYADIHFVKEPELEGNKLICFVGGMNKELERNLTEMGKKFNIINIDSRTNIYNIDKTVEIVLITNTEFLFRTKKIAQKLMASGNHVKIFYASNLLKSPIEYMVAISKSVEYDTFIQELIES